MSRRSPAREARPQRSTDRGNNRFLALIAGAEIILLAAFLVAGNIALVKALDDVLDVIHESDHTAYHAWAASCWTYSCRLQQNPLKAPTGAAAS